MQKSINSEVFSVTRFRSVAMQLLLHQIDGLDLTIVNWMNVFESDLYFSEGVKWVFMCNLADAAAAMVSAHGIETGR